MIYLLDTNILIHAKSQYYPIIRVPEFWSWLLHMGSQGRVKVVREIYSEIIKGSDELKDWVSTPEFKSSLLVPKRFQEVNLGTALQVVMNHGYQWGDDEVVLEKVKADPYLVAHALMGSGLYTVVTTEVSKPKKRQANRKIPDVCKDLGVRCINTFQMIDELDFKTSWKDN